MLILACWPWLAACPFYGRGPGFAPAGELLSCRDKKVTKEAPLPRAIRQNSLHSFVVPLKQAVGSQSFYVGARQSCGWRAGAGTLPYGWSFGFLSLIEI